MVVNMLDRCCSVPSFKLPLPPFYHQLANRNPFGTQVVEDGYEFFAKRQLVTLFSAPNYCGEFDNAGAMMSVDETLLCSFQVRLPTLGCESSSNGIIDIEASREEGQISLWWNEHGRRSTNDSAAQTKEKGRQQDWLSEYYSNMHRKCPHIRTVSLC